MKKYLLALILMAASISASAENLWTIGLGGVREDDGITKYHVATVDWQFSKHFEVSGGDIFTGSPVSTHKTPFGVEWLGLSLIEREDILYSSVGYVKLSRKTANLTSPFQFYLAFGAQYDGYSVSYRHISNAGTGGANYGEDLLVFAYTF